MFGMSLLRFGLKNAVRFGYYLLMINTKNLRSFITVKAHCS